MGGRNYELFATLSQFCARASEASAWGRFRSGASAASCSLARSSARYVNIRCPFCCFNQYGDTGAKCLNDYRFLLLEASDISAEVTFAGIGSHECRVRYSRTSSCIFRISVRYPVDMSENSSGVALTRSCKSKF